MLKSLKLNWRLRPKYRHQFVKVLTIYIKQKEVKLIAELLKT